MAATWTLELCCPSFRTPRARRTGVCALGLRGGLSEGHRHRLARGPHPVLTSCSHFGGPAAGTVIHVARRRRPRLRIPDVQTELGFQIRRSDGKSPLFHTPSKAALENGLSDTLINEWTRNRKGNMPKDTCGLNDDLGPTRVALSCASHSGPETPSLGSLPGGWQLQ